MNKTIIISFSLLLTFSGFGQENSRSEKSNLVNWMDTKNWKINAAASFSPGLLTENTYSLQVQGYLGFLQERIEMRGDIFYFLANYGDRPRFDMNHQLYCGAFYHFSEKAFQPYIGFQPGLALARSSEYRALDNASGEIKSSNIAVNPLASAAGGFKLYAERFFYAFVETRYILGKHKSNTYPIHLDEWRFSFGLGFFL